MINRYQYYIWAVIIYVVALSAYVYSGYENEKVALYKSLDKDLTQGASALQVLLKNDFHEQLTDEKSVSSQEDMQNIKKLSAYTKLTNLVYIYSYILDGDTVRFTSSSATPKELESSEGLSHYFDAYESPTEKLKESLTQEKINFENIVDKWGTFRSVYIPTKTKNGKVFLSCADIRIDFIQEKLNKILISSIFEALFYIAILFPFFIAFWFVNKKINAQLEETIDIRTKELAKSQKQISTLLNNADQGFLSFSRDFKINKEYSKVCTQFLGEAIEGENIYDLLLKNKYQIELFIETINDIFSQEEEMVRDCLLTLLPHEIILNNKVLSIEYKLIEDEKFMLIITNITSQKKLENKIKKEQEILKMIVQVVSDSQSFYDTKKEYENFIATIDSFVDEKRTLETNANEIYRMIHTFKGAFSQLYMNDIVKFLHQIESEISFMIKENKVSNEALLTLLKNNNFVTSLESELEIIKNILGEEFFKDANYIKVNFDYLRELQERVALLIHEEDQSLSKYKSIFEKILSLSHVKLITLLKPYNNLVNQLAKRLQKDIYNFEVKGDSDILISDYYKPFIRSLIHVFRNCVDHGIENSEIRAEMGKDENGTIACSFERVENSLRIVISDDGAGINTQKVLNQAIKNGILSQDDAKNISQNEIYNFIFHDRFSTKDEVTDISGRGVGMSALKAELDKLNGIVEIKSQENVGTTFIFTLAYEDM